MPKETTEVSAADKPAEAKKESTRDILLRGCEKAGGEFITVRREQLIEVLKAS